VDDRQFTAAGTDASRRTRSCHYACILHSSYALFHGGLYDTSRSRASLSPWCICMHETPPLFLHICLMVNVRVFLALRQGACAREFP